MASDDIDLDDVDFDDDLDIPDFDFDAEMGGEDDRTPVQQATTGFLTGVKDTALSTSFQRKVIRDSLPRGYSKAYDDALGAVDLGKELYDTAAESLAPAKSAFKKLGRTIAEKAEGKLPDKIVNRIKKLSEEEERRSSFNESREDLEIASLLTDVFGEQVKRDEQYRVDEQSERLVADAKEDARFKTSAEMLSSMRAGIERMVGYQDTVTAGYHRKSLELQYRQLFVAREQYSLLEGYVKETYTQLSSIVKNTALPDFVKMKTSESLREMMRERTVGRITESLSDYTRNIQGKIKDSIPNKVKSVGSSISEGFQSSMDMSEQMGDAPISGAEIGGSIVGGIATDTFGGRLGSWVGGKLRNNDTVRKVGSSLEYYSDNKMELMREQVKNIIDKSELEDGDIFIKGRKEPSLLANLIALGHYKDAITGQTIKDVYDINGPVVDREGNIVLSEDDMMEGPLETSRDRAGIIDKGKSALKYGVGSFLKDIIPDYQHEAIVHKDSLTLAEEVAPYTALTDRTITEIIPGLLGRILRETEMIRTGNDETEIISYNFEKGKFERESELQKDILNRILPENHLEYMRQELLAAVDSIDPDQTLSKEARSALTRQMLSDASRGMGFRVERYFTPEGLSTISDPAITDEIRSLLMKTFLNDDGSFREGDVQATHVRNKASRHFNRSKENLPNYKEMMPRMASTYGMDRLERMGLFREIAEGEQYQGGRRVGDMNKIIDRAMGEDVYNQTDKITARPSRDFEAMRPNIGSVSIDPSVNANLEALLEAVEATHPRVDTVNDWLVKIHNLIVDIANGGMGGNQPPPNTPPPTGPMSSWDPNYVLPYTPQPMASTWSNDPIDPRMGPTIGSGAISKKWNWRDTLNRGKDKVQSWNLRDKFRTAVDETSEGFYRARDRITELGGNVDLSGVKDSAKSSAEVIKDFLEDQVDSTKSSIFSEDKSDDYWDNARALIDGLKEQMADDTRLIVEAIERSAMVGAVVARPESFADKVAGGIGGALKGGGKMMGGIMNFYGNMWKTAGIGAVTAAKAGSKAIGWGADKLFGTKKSRRAHDVYIKGNPNPVLLKSKLEQGEYFDKETGEQLTSIDDIKGPVIDIDGNIVVSSEHIKAELLTDNEGKPLASKIMDLAKGALSYMTSPYRAMFGMASKAFGAAKDYWNAPRDIYVKGEEYPRLLATIMKNGGYLSKATGEPITTIEDIDGDAIDKEGNIVLTAEEMKRGLYDSRGKKIEIGMNFTTGLIKKGIGLVKGFYDGVWNMAGKGLNAVKDMFSGKFEGFSLFGGKTDKQVELLEEIRDILDERLEKKVSGDMTGDGFRDGSWQQKMFGKKDEEGEASKDEKSTGPDTDKSLIEKMGGLKGLLGLGEGGALSGLLGKIGLGGGAAKGAAAAGGAAKAGMLGKAGAMLGKGALMGAKGLLVGGKALAVGAAGLVSAPVLLGAAAIAAVAVGGWLVYKHLYKAPKGPIHRVRLAQYGINPDEKDHLARVSALENKLWDEVQFRDAGPELGTGVSDQELYEFFGVKEDDPDHVNRFNQWFTNRFKPVFLMHAAALNRFAPNTKILDADKKVSKENKVEYINLIKFQDGAESPYSLRVSPFDTPDPLPSGAAQVQAEIDAALEKFNKTGGGLFGIFGRKQPAATPEPPPTAEELVEAAEEGGRDDRTVQDSRSDLGSSNIETNGLTDDVSEREALRPTPDQFTEDDQSNQSTTGIAETVAQAAARSRDIGDVSDPIVNQDRERREATARHIDLQQANAEQEAEETMNRIVNLLDSSYRVQVNMEESLSEINDYFKRKAREERISKQPAQTADGVMNPFGFLKRTLGNRRQNEQQQNPVENVSVNR
jgi:hypothetical protein